MQVRQLSAARARAASARRAENADKPVEGDRQHDDQRNGTGDDCNLDPVKPERGQARPPGLPMPRHSRWNVLS